MSWQDILKNTSTIRNNWFNSKTPPNMYYYDKLNENLKKEFEEIFDKMLEDIQMGYLNGKVEDRVYGKHETENMQGESYLIDRVESNGRIAELKFQIAPKNSGMDKFGRFTKYYIYFHKMIDPVNPSRSEGMYLNLEEWDNLVENILNVKR